MRTRHNIKVNKLEIKSFHHYSTSETESDKILAMNSMIYFYTQYFCVAY